MKLVVAVSFIFAFALQASGQTTTYNTGIGHGTQPIPTSVSELPRELQAPAPQYSFGPPTEYNAARPDSKDVLRFRRGERYNSPDSPLPELGEDSDATLVGTLFDAPVVRFPFEYSDTVVVGTVNTGQSYLSDDRHDIYSEFRVTLEEVIKTPTAPFLRIDDSIDVQRHGGIIKLPSGKLLTRGFLIDSMPVIGGRYLFFLKHTEQTEDYLIETGYQLVGNTVYRLDDLSYQQSDTLTPLLLREETSVDEFLATVRAKKKQSP